jgi:hypothetical protein
VQIVYKGKLVDRRYKGAIPLCVIETCDKGAQYYVYSNQFGETYSSYHKFCWHHRDVED